MASVIYWPLDPGQLATVVTVVAVVVVVAELPLDVADDVAELVTVDWEAVQAELSTAPQTPLLLVPVLMADFK